MVPKASQTAAEQGEAELRLPNVGPKQLCALAHLGCARKAGAS